MRKWIIAGVAIGLLLGAAFYAYGKLGKKQVLVASPERREAILAVYSTGSIKAEQVARLRPEVGGEVLQVGVREGAEVRQGDLVMEVEVHEEEDAVREQSARVQEAQLNVREARANLDHERSLLEQGATTQQAVDDKQAIYNRAAAALRIVQATLTTRKSRIGKGKIASPITGIVTKVNVAVGDVVPANMESVTIIDPFSFKVYAEIDELDINRVRPGQEAVIAFDAVPGSRYRARVERVIPQANEVTKMIPVILYLLDPVPNLSDGLTATVNIIESRRPNALTIPSNSIASQRGDSAVVYLVTVHNKLQQRSVKLGIRGDEYVEVLDGLREDERVALNPEEGWENEEEVEIELKGASTTKPTMVNRNP